MTNIGGVEIGPGQPCRIVAEISNAHNGDLETAHKLIATAHRARADIVKFQCYTPDELVQLRGDGPAPEPWGSDGYTMRALYERAQTPHAWFPELVEHCEQDGIPWFASVFGPESLALLESLGCPAYKISAFEFGNAEFRAMVEATGKPVIRSHRGPSAVGPNMLYCPPGYPQEANDMVLANIRNGYLGLSYHGKDPHVPGFTLPLGSKLLECHVELDDTPSALESDVCLTMQALRQLEHMVRRAEVVLGEL